jgi:hypothetical protein
MQDMTQWEINLMSRRVLVIGLALLCAPSLFAAKRMTVSQFEEQLERLHGKSDSFVTDRIQSVELTQRATSTRLAQWLAAFPGKHEQLALIALADSSAFLNLPSSDLASLNEPSSDEQQAILARAVEYLQDTVHRLPDFNATRATLQFDNSLEKPKDVLSFGAGDFLNMPDSDRTQHLVGDLSLKVSYLHGAEVLNSSDAARIKLVRNGLTTWGEFGPVLSVVFDDSKANTLTWKGWEQAGAGSLAVFQYTVPHEKSHYLVSIRPRIEPQYPAYRGEIAIDQKTGSIARVTMLAVLDSDGASPSANIAVEYGQISLGQRAYICPVHAVAISRDVNVDDKGNGLTQINDVHFTDYHLFRGDVRVLAETPTAP